MVSGQCRRPLLSGLRFLERLRLVLKHADVRLGGPLVSVVTSATASAVAVVVTLAAVAAVSATSISAVISVASVTSSKFRSSAPESTSSVSSVSTSVATSTSGVRASSFLRESGKRLALCDVEVNSPRILSFFKVLVVLDKRIRIERPQIETDASSVGERLHVADLILKLGRPVPLDYGLSLLLIHSLALFNRHLNRALSVFSGQKALGGRCLLVVA